MRKTAKTMSREEYRKACKYVGINLDGQFVCRVLSALLYHTTKKIANVNCKCNCPRMRRYDRIHKDG